LIPRYQNYPNLRPGTAASIEALSEVPDDDKDEELMALEAMISEVESPSEASGGARSRTPSSSSIPVPTNSYRIRTPSSSSIPVPINQRTRTPTTGGSGNIQRSGSGLSENRSNRNQTAKTTTSYGADGSRITTTTSSYSYDASKAGASQQSSSKQW